MSDSSLEQLASGQGRLMRVTDDIDERNSIETNHLLEVDITRVVAVHVIYGEAKVRSVGVRLQDVAPEWRWRLRRSNVQED